MTAKEYLEQYQSADREIDELLERVKRLRSRAEKITPPYGSDGGSSPNVNVDKLPAIVETIIEEEERANSHIKELISLQDEVKAVISSVPKETYRKLLSMRYIQGISFERISVEMNYSYWHLTHYVHQKALEMVKIPLNTT